MVLTTPNLAANNRVLLLDEKALHAASPQGHKAEWLVYITQEITQSSSQALANLKESLTKKDWQAIFKEAHRTKGAFSLVGLQSLSDICKKIEVAATQQDEEALSRLIEQFKPIFSNSLQTLAQYANTESNTSPGSGLQLHDDE